MDAWSLEKAKNSFSEVVRRALDHQPQLVTRGKRNDEAVVVIAREDYERLVSPGSLVSFLAASPLARAVAEGSGGRPDDDDPFARDRDEGRTITF